MSEEPTVAGRVGSPIVKAKTGVGQIWAAAEAGEALVTVVAAVNRPRIRPRIEIFATPVRC